MMTNPPQPCPDDERKEMLAVCALAGISPDDILDHPEHGIMIKAHLINKLLALAPPSGAREQIGKWATDLARRGIRKAP